MISLKNIFLASWLLIVSGQVCAETTVALEASRDGGRWFLTTMPFADEVGFSAARVRVDFLKARFFHGFGSVKSALMLIHCFCGENVINIERIDLVGESGDEIAKISATEPTQGAAYLPPFVVKSALAHVCSSAS